MSTDHTEIPDEIYNKIVNICAAGDELAKNENYSEAIEKYSQAWSLLPEPKNHWNASTWVLAALIDAYFLSGHNIFALEALQYVMTCPDAIGNPFLHLRFGEVLFDMSQEDGAADELMRAYMGGGEEIFAAEDPKYLEFLKTRAIIE